MDWELFDNSIRFIVERMAKLADAAGCQPVIPEKDVWVRIPL